MKQLHQLIQYEQKFRPIFVLAQEIFLGDKQEKGSKRWTFMRWGIYKFNQNT